MNIAFDISPIIPTSSSGHKVRGVGMYISGLQECLLRYDKENHYTFFTKNEVIEKDIDIVHYPYFDPFYFQLPIIRFHKTMITIHDLTPLVFPKKFPVGIKGQARWFVQRQIVRKIDRIITDSLCSKKDILRFVNVPADMIDIVYLAADEVYKEVIFSQDQKKTLQRKYQLPEKFIFYVGDVTWNKNLPRLVQAAIDLQYPLVMAGKALIQNDFDKRNRWNTDVLLVQDLAKKNQNIVRLGFVPDEDLVLLYNLASVFVMPSLYEGFGLPVLEAMSCGVPVVTTKEGSLPEVVGEAALYVDAYNTASIAEGIRTVWNNEKLQRDLREKGMKQAMKFSWKKTALQTIASYQKVFNK